MSAQEKSDGGKAGAPAFEFDTADLDEEPEDAFIAAQDAAIAAESLRTELERASHIADLAAKAQEEAARVQQRIKDASIADDGIENEQIAMIGDEAKISQA